ncbi:23S rRNA (adenine(2030)-N(6))-methyltransferase RlmJ [Thiothrix litoralis]|uniref:Ribosomal RNA large subunit methyltransferase J n=1 Tax=Thiothrix litoralis TaxID=2891210 RepID=A0ABX7WR01_9GAMM|nr:23S rRNA (adenine(2030)-N(6))-methyltransferase RlmJ [Thiothrix litoralis]QTR44778.1 23S rRNA (adenine(2030)-N(6))-methyltransferase RlmJ [Thiothrix litoralis]
MLSYRHAFHAGNHADVIKHLVLVLTLDYYQRKDKPFWYIDTHAGSGLYRLSSAESQKTREFAHGIQTLWNASDLPDELLPYVNLIRSLNPPPSLDYYPGSPWLAAQLLRKQDQLRLFELHPNDFSALDNNLGHDKRIQISKQDGLKGLLGLLPPITRRAVTLIDPSYELKTDYSDVVTTLAKAYQRFATGTYLLWYPVIERQRVKQMIQGLQQTGIAGILQIEFCPVADSAGLGMSGSGLFVINPPWLLAKQMQTLLPWLHQKMADANGHFTVTHITPEKNT